MSRNAISTNRIAPVVGPFSAAITAGDLLFLSGQVAQDPATGKLIAADVATQTERIFENAVLLLEAAGKNLSDVMKVTVFLTNMAEFSAMNEVYGRYFDKPYPARTTVAVVALPLGAFVELDIIAR
jgi:2-iminobutanoate/2-iminopropanoate deaminase